MGNFFSEIGKITGLSKITTKGVLQGAAGVVGGMFGGPVGAAAGVSLMGALTKTKSASGGFTPAVLSPVSNLPVPVGGLPPAVTGPIMDKIATLVQKYGPGVNALVSRFGPWIVAGWSAAQIIRALAGGSPGGGYMSRLNRAIDIAEKAPPAIQSRVFGAMMPHKHRGITYTELRGFRRVTSLLRSVGMHPRGLHGRKRR